MNTKLDRFITAIKRLCDADNRDDLASHIRVHDLDRAYKAKQKQHKKGGK